MLLLPILSFPRFTFALLNLGMQGCKAEDQSSLAALTALAATCEHQHTDMCIKFVSTRARRKISGMPTRMSFSSKV